MGATENQLKYLCHTLQFTFIFSTLPTMDRKGAQIIGQTFSKQNEKSVNAIIF